MWNATVNYPGCRGSSVSSEVYEVPWEVLRAWLESGSSGPQLSLPSTCSLGRWFMGMWSTSTLHFTRRIELSSAIPMFLEFFEWFQPYPSCCQDVLELYARRQALYKVVCSVWVFVYYLGWYTLFGRCTLCRVTYLMWNGFGLLELNVYAGTEM